jgi:hypothetical protein
MHPTEGLDFIRQNAPIALPGRTVSGEEGKAEPRSRGLLCPFGCGPRDHDEYGYCRHLQGFTDGHQELDERTGEMVTVYEWTRKAPDMRGFTRWITGEMRQDKTPEGGVDEYAVNRILQPNDIVVHLNNGRTGKSFAGTQWARVYRPRKPGETPVFRPGTSQTPDLSQLQKVLEDLQTRDKKKDKIIAKLMEVSGVNPDELDLDL